MTAPRICTSTLCLTNFSPFHCKSRQIRPTNGTSGSLNLRHEKVRLSEQRGRDCDSCSEWKTTLILDSVWEPANSYRRQESRGWRWRGGNLPDARKGTGRRRTTKSLASIRNDSDYASQLQDTREHSMRTHLCTCCGRRSLLTLGGVLVAASGVEDLKAAESYYLDVDAVREAVHPARPDWYEEFHAKVMDTSMRSYEAQIASYKTQLFTRLDENVKTIMELGIGTGPNLAFYGGRASVTKVLGVDPNEKMAPYAKAAALAAGLAPSQFKFLHAVGEGLPLPNESVDAVVCTLVLCSVTDVSSTLKEVQRVLKPGGTFLFVEHVAAPDNGTLRFWQNVLDPIQQLVADGCHLTRDTLSLIEAAQFAGIDAQRISVKGASLIAPHIIGTARTA